MTIGTSSIKVVDLFAGCGGLTQGFHEYRPDGWTASPFRTVGAVESDIAAASTYAANFAQEAGGTDHIHAGDIKDWDPAVLGTDVDVILGGPPCQGFSGLGKEDVNDPRNKLWREYKRVVNKLKPKVFIIENVDRFLKSGEFASLVDATASDGDLSDYQLAEPRILNAADYGVPQARKRAIVLATRRDLIKNSQLLTHPAPSHRKPVADESAAMIEIDDRKPWETINSIFARTPNDAPIKDLPDRRCSPLGTELPGTFHTYELHIGRNPTQMSLARYKAIPEGGNRKNLTGALTTENWRGHNTGSGDVMGRMHWNQPSVTIRTEFYKPEKGRYLHPDGNVHRPITHYEAALIQGFPESFKWCGSKIAIGKQIGNAVPVGLSRALASQVYEFLVSANAVIVSPLQQSA
ncbi:DNA cytosine methyltransferase [Nocardia arthritidis]|nr:DNA cytosine methyltransferase [Nocardia arthritidis]